MLAGQMSNLNWISDVYPRSTIADRSPRRPLTPDGRSPWLELVVPGVDRDRSVVVLFVVSLLSLILFVPFLLFACFV